MRQGRVGLEDLTSAELNELQQRALRCCLNEERFVDECTSDFAVELFESGSFERKHEVTTQAPQPEDFERERNKK